MTSKISSIVCSLILAAVFSSYNVNPFIHDENNDRLGYKNADTPSENIVGHAPIFYGATDITIDKNVTESFDIKNPRFRIFARDYEDGDLTPYIECTSCDVNPTVGGDYSISYKVIDSSNNQVSLTVPVHVSDESNGNCTIERTVYCIPAMENMKKTGTERCNTGDSQILGIYVPYGSSFTFKSLDTDFDVKSKITFFTDTRRNNYIQNNIATDGSVVTIQNTNTAEGSGSVPLLTSPRLSSEEYDVTHRYEISYGSDVLPLDYYHYKDDEENFKTKVKANANSFSIVDGEAIMYVVPLRDVDNLTKDISTLDGILEYFLEVVNRMDKMIGLSFNPMKETDRNYRTKYIAVADGSYAGSGIGAYYAGDYIATGSTSMYTLCMYSWGILHEIGHGYQGYFGKGTFGGTSLYFNETGNNILAHYIQVDKNLYKKDGDWLGSLSSIEEKNNKIRLDGNYIFTNTSGTYTYTHEKLYFLINLFDAFEGKTTYGKLFSYYRSLVLADGYDKNYTVADIYALFFTDEYKANIVPYFDAWHIDLTPSVEKKIINDGRLQDYVIPYDTLTSNELTAYIGEDTTKLKYAPVLSSTLNELIENKLATLSIELEIDDFTKLANKVIVLKKKGLIERSVKVNSASLTVEQLPIGNYQIQFPALIGYESDEVVGLNLVGNTTNTIKQTYKKVDVDNYVLPTTIKIYGVRGTIGFTLAFQEKNTKAKLTLGASDLGNQTNYWKALTDTVYSSVTITNSQGTQFENLQVMGGGYYCNLSTSDGTTGTNASTSVDIDIGTIITIYNERADLVHTYASINGTDTQMSEYDNSEKTKRYKITEDGIEFLDQGSFNTKEIAYSYERSLFMAELDSYASKLTDEVLDEKNESLEIKNSFYKAYSLLSDEDKANYSQIMERIEKGGKPRLSLKNESIEINQGDSFNPTDYIDSITDNEDGEIDFSSAVVEYNVETSVVGTYNVTYKVTDSDGNEVSKTMEVIVKEKKVEPFDEDKKENSVLNIILISSLSALGIILVITFVVVEYMKIGKNK